MAYGFTKITIPTLRTREWLSLLILFLLLSLVVVIGRELLFHQETAVEQIKARGYLTVATRNGPTTYYESIDAPAGLEYDLAKRFANKLGVELRIELADSIRELNELLLQGRADIVASGLPVAESTRKLVQYSLPYLTVNKQIIDKQNSRPRIRNIEHLTATVLTLPTASHLETLVETKQSQTHLNWVIAQDQGFEELLERVATGEVRYALANSHEVQAIRHYYPELRIAFNLSEEIPVAWALRNSEDVSLLTETRAFFSQIKENGVLTQLYERYYGHVTSFDYSGTHLFMRRIESRLPLYREIFEVAAKEYNLDWRLLAAMAHQESQWDRDAISPTGVRGLMMLTLTTAAQVGVSNRLDPEQSIHGGAKYFAQMLDRIPDAVTEPDRTWMALAAYNIGFGHLTDAREICRIREQDPDLWVNVKSSLPLLRKKQWYKRVKYGYARGTEPVSYVQNIRRYYDILKKTFDENTVAAE